NLPLIYIQQFWDTILYDKKAGCYKCQLNEQWFDLTKKTLREALQITPVNRNQAFATPPSINGLIDLSINWATLRKKRATMIVIPSVRFTKMIIHHLQRMHRFHPRPDSPLYLSNEEHVLGYLKFSAKGTKREIFRMPIPGRLITANIRAAPYYQEYQENVAKHRGFLAGETRSTQDLPTPRPAKPARKPYVSRNTRTSRGSPKSVGVLEAKRQRRGIRKVVLGIEKGSQNEGQARPDPNAQAEGQTGSDTSAQAEGQAGSNSDETSEGQAGSNPDETSEGHAGPDPGNVEARVQSTSSPVVYAGTDREHMDIDVANVSLQPSTEQLYEGFTATIYQNVQENLKLIVDEPVLLEKPASSSGTLSSLQHLSIDFTFGDQFFSDKPSDADKIAETKVKSMVNVPIQQAMSSIFLMTSPIIDLTSRHESPKEHPQLKATTTDTTTTTTTTLPPRQAPQQSTTEAMMVKRIGELEHTLADLIQVNKTIEERLDKHGACLYTLEQLDIPQQVSIAVSKVVTDAVDWAMQVPLRNRFRDLPEADMKEILHQRMWETDSYKSHEVHMHLFEALEKSINRDQSEELTHDLAEVQKKRKKGRESPKTPPGSPSHQLPPLPPPAGPSGTSGAPRAFGSQVTPPPPPPTSTNQDSPSTGSAAPSPAKTAATTKHQAWSTPDVTLKPLVSMSPEDLDMDEVMGPDEQAQLSDEEDIRSAHIPTVNLRQGWWKPFEEERPTTPEPAWSIR
nr:histone deacetylase 14 [Tanacetum cinerariifolium]